jgi:hypothetical protein
MSMSMDTRAWRYVIFFFILFFFLLLSGRDPHAVDGNSSRVKSTHRSYRVVSVAGTDRRRESLKRCEYTGHGYAQVVTRFESDIMMG